MSDHLSPEIIKNRKPDHPIHPMILNRWSPRAMSGEAIRKEELLSLFEAARWAPSCYNEQPWKILYATKDSPHFSTYLSLLVEFNKSWAHKAAVLGVIISRKTFEKNGKPSATHAYDAGSAWENLALEGTSRGLVVHGMGGFDYEKTRQVLKIPEEYQVNAMFAVGKRAPKEVLPPELEAKETPSQRKKIEEFAFEGFFR